ncbi:stage III sporulation protein SpoIIIAB [Bacillus solimangrovi]|uniref:Stage III sporulation protein SpoAB n=1 Tax=Bacillus solimangrovi TaxID=1305675 RepID=A0A1E5LK63_9BACI|nr:stage III sporulation protein SpoIIIAB [Bacillus solimangrovi]OEH94482.1 stage III sporulation protein SpoAB [Bacillus solimangrovi]
MIKIIGALTILLCSTWVGFETARRLSERPRQLRQLKAALQALEAEIMFGHLPVAEACIRIANQTPKPFKWFFDRFAKRLQEEETASLQEVWIYSLKEVWRMTALTDSEFEILRQFGETLGKHDKLSQKKHIQLALVHLEREEEEARVRQQKYEKMVKSLCFLMGLLLVILLM